MRNRYFWRRGFAYFIDWIILGFCFAILILFLNLISPVKIIAPPILSSSGCESVPGPISSERMNELFPLEDNQNHFQAICTQTNLFVSTFHTTVIGKAGKIDGQNFQIKLSYGSDKEGNFKLLFPSDFIFYLFSPLVFALLISMRGTTPGKSLLKLHVGNLENEKPSLSCALIREYAKGIVFALSGLIFLVQLIYMYDTAFQFDLDGVAKTLNDLTLQTSSGGLPFYYLLGSVIFALAILWFYFGSFVRWNGQTYWDRFAGTYVELNESA